MEFPRYATVHGDSASDHTTLYIRYVRQTYEFRHPVTETTEPIDRPPLKNELPDPTGDNKYTKSMVPGYTGQTPHNCVSLIILDIRNNYFGYHFISFIVHETDA